MPGRGGHGNGRLSTLVKAAFCITAHSVARVIVEIRKTVRNRSIFII